MKPDKFEWSERSLDFVSSSVLGCFYRIYMSYMIGEYRLQLYDIANAQARARIERLIWDAIASAIDVCVYWQIDNDVYNWICDTMNG